MPAAHKIVMPEPGFGTDGPPRTPFVLHPSAALRMARAHEAQYAEAINGYRGRFNLLDYLFSSHRMIAEALESGTTSRELFSWACEQFEPRVPCSYPQFRAALAKFRRLMEIPARQERLKRLAARLRGAAVENRPSAKDSPVPSIPAASPARPISSAPERLDSEVTLPAPVSTLPTSPELTPTPVPPKAGPRPVPVAPRLGGVSATGGSAEFLRRLSALDPHDQSTATIEEKIESRLRERERQILQEHNDERAARGLPGQRSA